MFRDEIKGINELKIAVLHYNGGNASNAILFVEKYQNISSPFKITMPEFFNAMENNIEVLWVFKEYNVLVNFINMGLSINITFETGYAVEYEFDGIDFQEDDNMDLVSLEILVGSFLERN